MNILQQLKPMRVLLLFVAIVLIIMRPDPGTEVIYEGVGVFTTLLIPVLAPIFFMLLLLDSLVASIWRTQTEGSEKKRYNMILVLNLLFAIILFSYWLPYIKALG